MNYENHQDYSIMPGIRSLVNVGKRTIRNSFVITNHLKAKLRMVRIHQDFEHSGYTRAMKPYMFDRATNT